MFRIRKRFLISNKTGSQQKNSDQFGSKMKAGRSEMFVNTETGTGSDGFQGSPGG